MDPTQVVGVEEVERLLVPLRDYVSDPIELPEPAQRLDLQSRAGDLTRQFKHIHQVSLFHVENYRRANQIKLVALLEGYLLVARAENYLGQYLFARSILELAAFTYDVAMRLKQIADKPDVAWRSKGEEFVSLVVRARFATSDGAKRQALETAGMSANLLKPLNVMNSLKVLSQECGWEDVVTQYDKFCDFVHHNSSSQFASSVGFRMGDRTGSHGGGGLIMKTLGPIACYVYPVPNRAECAEMETSAVVVKAAGRIVESINEMPSYPFSDSQVFLFTGSAIGISEAPSD